MSARPARSRWSCPIGGGAKAIGMYVCLIVTVASIAGCGQASQFPCVGAWRLVADSLHPNVRARLDLFANGHADITLRGQTHRWHWRPAGSGKMVWQIGTRTLHLRYILDGDQLFLRFRSNGQEERYVRISGSEH